MDPTISVSKGCFVFKNGATRAEKSAKKSPKRKRTATTSLLGNEVTNQPFYGVYRETWQQFQRHIDHLQQASYARTLDELVNYVASESVAVVADTYGHTEEILPTAALLTGINQPDHLNQFETLTQRLYDEGLAAGVCVLQSRDCSTLKSAVETMVYSFVEREPREQDECDRDHKRLRRSQCNIKHLKAWYRNNCYDRKENDPKTSDEDEEVSPQSGRRQMLVIILPDFECFNVSVLQDFILILNAHCGSLPFILVMGVATAVSAVHNTLPYHVTSKIKLRIFQTQPAPMHLNEILEEVLLSPKYAFHLSGKAFKFLTHIFLFYDFSIHGFIQGFKYCLMEHFFQGNAFALCNSYNSALNKIKALTHDDMETIRKQLSFRPYVEGINDCKRVIAVLTDDSYLKRKLPQLLRDCHIHFIQFRYGLELLHALVADLPKCPLGRFRREVYVFCMSKDLTAQAEYKECWQMLSFMSKDEFVTKVSKAVEATDIFIDSQIEPLELGEFCLKSMKDKLKNIKDLLTKVVMAGTQPTKEQHEALNTKVTSPEETLKELSSRQDLKARLMQMSKQDKPISEFAKAVHDTLNYIQTAIVNECLLPLDRAPPLHELFVFSDIATVRRNIIGAPRAALHTALNNPHFYLQCKCCTLQEQTQLLSTLPDLSVVYKLHLECGRMINLFDWLQAFRAVVESFNDEDGSELQQEQINPQIQARFTRAIAELQFLGYIKMSKRKTDHATRLTW